jgi:LysR family glycine cleavage system transcriptional activator
MPREVPSLNAVLVFEAAARHSRLIGAGAELGVTPGAVSQQVRLLEARLGVRLFDRHPNGVRLTEEGRDYLADVGPAIRQIAGATHRLTRAAGSGLVRVSALPALAECWLIGRLKAFHAEHPEITIELSAEAELVDFGQGQRDVGLRYGNATEAHLDIVPLFRDELLPVCSLALLERHAVAGPSDLAGAPLLFDTYWRDDWRIWCEAAGLPAFDLERAQRFTLYSLALEAACQGVGILMAHRALVARDLARGTLVAPVPLATPAPKSYYAVVPARAASRPPVRAFVRWLQAATAEGGDRNGPGLADSGSRTSA